MINLGFRLRLRLDNLRLVFFDLLKHLGRLFLNAYRPFLRLDQSAVLHEVIIPI